MTYLSSKIWKFGIVVSEANCYPILKTVSSYMHFKHISSSSSKNDTTLNLHSKLEIVDFPYLLNPIKIMDR
jgi:hypothetical protein